MRSRCEKKGFADGRSRGRFRMIAEAKASGAEVGRGEDKIERFKQFLLFVEFICNFAPGRSRDNANKREKA